MVKNSVELAWNSIWRRRRTGPEVPRDAQYGPATNGTPQVTGARTGTSLPYGSPTYFPRLTTKTLTSVDFKGRVGTAVVDLGGVAASCGYFERKKNLQITW